MKKKIGIFLDFDQNSGGGYHEASYLVDKILKNNTEKYEFVFISSIKNLKLNISYYGCKSFYFNMNAFNRYICFLRNFGTLARRLKKYFFLKNSFEYFLRSKNIDLVYFPGPSQYALYLENIDYILTVPDVSHRENVEIPEWSHNEEFYRREELLEKSLPRSYSIITNAEAIKKMIVDLYGVLKEKVHVINQQPSPAVSNYKENKLIENEFKTKFKLPEKYIFYPAMYLPQKNHKCIIDAINILNENNNVNISAVFCGYDKGYLKSLIKYKNDKNFKEKIIFLEFVDQKFLPYLYKNSSALVMPTLSGPTNLPVWEAFKMKKPVIYSNIINAKSVYGDGAHYINPLDTKELLNAIKKIIENKSYRDQLIEKGTKKINENNFKNEIKIFDKLFENYFKTKEAWKFN